MMSSINHNQQFKFSGLTEEEVQARRAKGQINCSDTATTSTIPTIIYNNLITVFNGILLLSIIALVVIHAYVDTLFLAAVAFFNSIAGIIEEIRAKIFLDRLALLVRKVVIVIRAGQSRTINLTDLVQDDLIILAAGEQIVADGQLISDSSVYVDEALLTGESDNITKQQGSSLFSGSFCVAGSGIYVAKAIGNSSGINKLASQAKEYKTVTTPIQHYINTIVQWLTGIMLLLIILVVIGGYIQNLSMAARVLAIVTVIKSLVPQGLILIVTLAFAFAAIRAVKMQILVQKLNAIESMSHLTTLCLDKTGTLGTANLRFIELQIFNSSLDEMTRKIRLFVGNTSHKNLTITALEKQFNGIHSEVIDELPFLSAHKYSAIRVRDGKDECSLWLGAPETLAAKLSSVQQQLLEELRQQGLRVLLLAETTNPLPVMANLHLLGLIVLGDELRPHLIETVKFYESRGVKLKILSGDHPTTVATLAKQVGIGCSSGGLVNGQDLLQLAPEEFATATQQGQFFGNLTPKQKLQIIRQLQNSGEYVGMIGDGVNDILALKQANIGIAMNSGSAAARDVADVILLQNNFTHLPALSLEGDRIVHNIKRVSRLFVTKNVYCLFFILFVGFVGLEFPFSPRLITWINIIIGIPTTVLMLLNPTLGQQKINHFLADIIKFSMLAGITIAFFSLLADVIFCLVMDQTELYGKTAAVSVTILMSLYLVFTAAAVERKQNAKTGQKWIIWSVLVAGCGISLLAIYWPAACKLLGLVSLDLNSWIIIIPLATMGMLALKLLLKKTE